MIKKLPNKKLWRIYSLKKINVKGELKHKNLGTFTSLEKAENHEREIEFFKHKKLIKKFKY